MNSSFIFHQFLYASQAELNVLDSLPFSKTGTRRLCLHSSEDSPLHVMLVQAKSGQAFPRHSHTDGEEVIIILQGSLNVSVWKSGLHSPPINIVLKSSSGVEQFIFIPKNIPHATNPIEGCPIYLEVKLGPFEPTALKVE